MKQYQTNRSEDSITYQPALGAAKAVLVLLSVMEIIFVATTIWILSDNTAGSTRLGLLVAFPFVVAALSAAIVFIARRMRIKIVISTEGIEYYSSNGDLQTQIDWSEVSGVYFHQDPWRGMRSCRIFLQKQATDANGLNIPVAAVDEGKLVQLIPNHLWQNKPWQ